MHTESTCGINKIRSIIDYKKGNKTVKKLPKMSSFFNTKKK